MTPLSRGARLCEALIRAAKTRRGGVRVCGRPYLARRLGCSQRTVSRYLRELREAGRLEVTPPRKVRTSKGWRTTGTNAYRLPCRHNLAPHVHKRRSGRDDTPVTPLPNGSRTGGLSRPRRRPVDNDTPLIDPAAEAAALVEALLARGSGA